MEKTEIGIGLIGAGARSAVLKLLFGCGTKLRLRGVYDPDAGHARERAASLGFPQARICASEVEVLESAAVDWVLVFSPNCFHAGQVAAALRAGKDVFTEKPMATALEDCEEVCRAYQQSGRQLATGFVLRYSPIYRKIRELLDAGEIGRIISIEADDNLPVTLGSYIMRNWRRRRANAGPYILEKNCHDLDLLNWFTGSLPARVASFGGLDFFVPKNERLRREYTDAEGRSPFTAIPDDHGEASPFLADKDIVDNQVCILEYRNGIRATFHATLANRLPDRRMYISGSEGTLVLSREVIRVRRLGEEAVRTYDFHNQDEHGGGDAVIMRELYETMCGGGAPKSSGMQGLRSAVVALGLDEAQRTGTVVDLDAVWRRLGIQGEGEA